MIPWARRVWTKQNDATFLHCLKDISNINGCMCYCTILVAFSHTLLKCWQLKPFPYIFVALGSTERLVCEQRRVTSLFNHFVATIVLDEWELNNQSGGWIRILPTKNILFVSYCLFKERRIWISLRMFNQKTFPFLKHVLYFEEFHCGFNTANGTIFAEFSKPKAGSVVPENRELKRSVIQSKTHMDMILWKKAGDVTLAQRKSEPSQ